MDGITAFERNTAGLMLLLPSYYPSAQVYQEDSIITVLAGREGATFNGVLILNDATLTADRLASIEAQYQQQQLHYGIELSSDEILPSYHSILDDCGYTMTVCDPIMYAEGPLRTSLNRRENPIVTIRKVNSAADREYYKQVLIAAFDIPPGVSQDFFDSMLAIKESCQMIAWMDGAPVGSGMLLCTNGAASIYNVATLPEVQHQGVGTAMMRALHHQALEEGYMGTVLVVASEEARSLYEHLGYRRVGWRFTYEKGF